MHSKKSKQRQHKVEFDAIGTKWVIEFEGSPAFSRVEKIIEDFDKNFSRFRKDSLVTKMSQAPGNYTFPDPEMLSLYASLYKLTGGLVTPLVGNLMEQIGYDATYSLNPKSPQAPPNWDDALDWQPPKLIVKKPVLLDFGAAGKGRLIDLVGEELERQGVSSFIIDAGGDILIKGQEAKIGLEHPEDQKQVIGTVTIKNGSIAGSAGNRRKWGEFHHIFNPSSLLPVNDVLAVWVVANTAMLADALSTCLFFVEPDKLSNFEFDYLIVYPDYTFKRSPNFPGETYEANR